MELPEILACEDATTAYMELARRYFDGNEQDRKKIIEGWDFGRAWKYPDFKRLPCTIGERYSPEERVKALLLGRAIRSGTSFICEPLAAGLDADSIFRQIARISPPAAKSFLERFASRPEGLKSMSAFFLVRFTNAEGETEIHQVWPKPRVTR
jgi:hypothetical protein